jgi:ParB/RepB/Spo0J family partition protein
VTRTITIVITKKLINPVVYVVNMIVNKIKLSDIVPSPFQSRFNLRGIEELAISMASQGLQTPPTVRPLPDGRFEIAAGTRRVETARYLGWSEIPCFVMELSDEEAASYCITENIQREDLNPIEEAWAYKRYKEKFNVTDKELGERFGKSRSYITNSLSLLRIDEFLQACLIHEKITVSHARLINTLPEEIPKYRVADLITDWNLTVEELRNIIKTIKSGKICFSWTLEIPITSILILSSAFEVSSRYRSGIIIVDTARRLYGGLDALLEARERGEKSVIAEIFYYTEVRI